MYKIKIKGENIKKETELQGWSIKQGQKLNLQVVEIGLAWYSSTGIEIWRYPKSTDTDPWTPPPPPPPLKGIWFWDGWGEAFAQALTKKVCRKGKGYFLWKWIL